jgi:hypothetical protein
MIVESERTSRDPAKLFLWPYDVPHGAFGGLGSINVPPSSTLTPSDYSAKGKAIASAFIPSFIDLFVAGDTSAHGIFTGQELPEEIADATWWSYLPAYIDLDSTPVIPRDFVVDQVSAPNSRFVVDDFEGGGAFSSTLGVEQVEVGAQLDLNNGTNTGSSHIGIVARVRWGGSLDSGELTWTINGGGPVNLQDFSFFSIRVGQELILSDGDVASCSLPPGDPRSNALELHVRLLDAGGESTVVQLGPVIQQHSQIVPNAGGGGVDMCAPRQFMATLRIPMKEFCQNPDFDTSAVVSATLVFPELAYNAGVYIDTVEFTRHPLDSDGFCL